MNKVAAEKIAQEYYNIGVQLAMQNSGLVKEAGLPKEIIKKLVQAPSAVLGGIGSGYVGLGAMEEYLRYLNPDKFRPMTEHLNTQVGDILGKTLPMELFEGAPLGIGTLLAGLGLGAAGAGAMAGSHLTGKGVDLVHRGGSKAIDALKKLRT